MQNPDLNYKKIKYFQQLLLYTFSFFKLYLVEKIRFVVEMKQKQ